MAGDSSRRGPIRFDGQVAIVTGAGKGLGRAYALLLAERGAAVVVNNRHSDPARPASADVVAEEIRAAGGRAVANTDSVEDAEAGQRMVAQAIEAFGGLDIVIANAGVDQHSALHKTSVSDFERIFAINFHGTLYLTMAALPIMREARYGRFLMTASSAGLYGQHGLSSYGASKAAIVGLMRTVALEGASRGIQANAIAPYAFTQMTAAHMTALPREATAPDLVAPLAAWLVHRDCPATGDVYLAGSGHFGRAEMRENEGVVLPFDGPISPEDAADRFETIRDLDRNRAYADAMAHFFSVLDRVGVPLPGSSGKPSGVG